jgi:type VI protein secretion system component VasK
MGKEDSWHLSKSVPVTLIVGLITQGAAIVWTVSMMMADISDNREDIVNVQQRVGRLEEAVHEQAVSMARIDENIKAIRQAVEKMAER